MMGHEGLIKLDKNYFKEHIDELIEEYIQSIPYLTIDDSARTQLELDKVNREKSELEKKNEENQLVKNEVFRQGRVIENLSNELEELKKNKKTS